MLKIATSVAASMLLYQGALAESVSAASHESSAPTSFKTVTPQTFAESDFAAYSGLYDSATTTDFALSNPYGLSSDSLAIPQEQLNEYEAGDMSVGTIVIAAGCIFLLYGIAQDAASA